MYSDATLAPWSRLVVSLALEIVVLIGVAALVASFIRSGAGQRAAWRIALIALAGLVLAELAGLGSFVAQWLRPKPAAVPPIFEVVVTTSTPSLPLVPDAPAAAEFSAPPTVVPTARVAPGLIWSAVFLSMAGLGWFLARWFVGAWRCARALRRATSAPADVEERTRHLCRRLGIRRRVAVKEFAGLSGPVALGVLRPVIGLPAGFSTRYTPAQQDAMLAHELAHVAALDAFWMFAADLTAALLWWHPLVWWARGRHRAASEAAADEASLLLDNGPAVLAECLVALGRQLAGDRTFGGLGMAEHRFRSQLGRRVERLLALRAREWRPWRGPAAWLTRVLAPAGLAVAALAAAAWLLPRDTRAASVGEAFLQSPVGLVTTALLTADENDTPKLILQGRKLLDAGKTNEAEARWRAVLELDPGNPVAHDYLATIGRTNLPVTKPVVAPVVPPAFKPAPLTNLVRTSAARQRIYDKLDGTRLGTVKYDNLPLQLIVDRLVRETMRQDPDGKGINFILSSPAIDPAAPTAPPFDPAAGLPLAAGAAPEANIGSAVIRIDPAIQDVTLRQLLDVIVKTADRPLKYSVEDYGVLFAARTTNELAPLHTRWFRIDPNTSMQGLQGVADRRQPPSGGARNTNTTNGDRLFTLLRDYFKAAGVELDPPKSMSFSETRGMLMVRATLQDLDLIEQAVQVLNMAPPQVVIEARFYEVPEETLGGFQLLLGSAHTNTAGIATNTAAENITAILTPPQYAVVRRALEQKPGVTALAAPRVLTPSGRQAQIKTVEVKTIVTDLDFNTILPPEPGQPPQHPPIAEPFELGPCLDVVPSVAADGFAVHLTLIPSIKEFVGYDLDSPVSKDIWDYVESSGANPAPARAARAERQPYPLPVFRLRQIVTSAVVWDGQTVMLMTRVAKDGLPEKHIAHNLPKAALDRLNARIQAMKKPEKKTMLVFVTPTIVDPAGNRVHTEEEIPEHVPGLPPSVAPAGK